jgi:RNA polymerase sigma-70 factor, ECF subfamily
VTDEEHKAVDPAFDAQALACLPDVARFAQSLTRDATAADDLVQETYLRAYRSHSTFVEGYDMRRWLFSICHHAWLRIAQRERRVVLTEEGDDAELETMAAVMGHVAAQRSGLDRFVTSIDLGSAIQQAIDTLSPTLQSVVLLVDVQGLTYEEAAEVLQIPVGTVRSRLFRARRLLQEQLFEYARDAGVSISPSLATRHPRAPQS